MISRARESAASVGAATGAFRLARALTPGRAARSRLTILAYHRVVPLAADADETYPFDVELVSATPAQFREQMTLLADAFTPLSIDEVVDRLARGQTLPERSVVVTFDDGFADNYEHAFPILRDCGVPACFFVSTRLIGGRETFWFDRLAHLLMHVPAQSVRDPRTGKLFPERADPASRRAACYQILRTCKDMQDDERVVFLADLDNEHGLAPAESVRTLSTPMTWPQVAEMAAGGMTIGSHGASHALLSRLSKQDAEDELRESRDRIAAETGKVPLTLAYPVGGPAAFSQSVIDSARSLGYQLGVTYMSGENPWPLSDPFRLHRLHVERTTSVAYLEAMLTVPRLFV